MAKAKKAASKKKPSKKVTKKPVARKPAAKKAAKAPARKAPVPFTLVDANPGFTVNDARASLAWYCDVLGFTVAERWEREGVFIGASLAFGQVTINIGQDDWRQGRDRVKGQGSRIYITTSAGIEQYAADVQARGGVLDQPLGEGWGFKAFSINDPDGFKLTFMTPLKAK